MGHDHTHAHGLTATGRHRGRLIPVLAATLSVMLIQVAGYLPRCTGAKGADQVLDKFTTCLGSHFDAEHCTFQLEPASHYGHESPQHA